VSLIEWKEAFSVGVPSVDLEHRDLIALINDLHGMMGEGATQEQVSAALGEIYAQISAHFALEEKYMRDTRYAAYPTHKEDHESLLDELRDIMDRVEDDGRYDEARLSRELERWFSEHFRTHDAKLHRHANPRTPGS
jgi:hemerythrin-like metal-binding protein